MKYKPQAMSYGVIIFHLICLFVNSALLYRFVWPGTHLVDRPASASQVFGIKGIHHHAQPSFSVFIELVLVCRNRCPGSV